MPTEPYQLSKEVAALYSIHHAGERIGATATHDGIFPRFWWAQIGGRTVEGKTRKEALAWIAAAQAEAVVASMLQWPYEVTRLCRDDDCPECGWPETYTEVCFAKPTAGADAIGCRRCGWRVAAA